MSWLIAVLASQSPALRASNSDLVAYTGCRNAIVWLDENVGSPVTGNWGTAAALLGVAWPLLTTWLQRGGAHQLMALDALIAYRKPAPNMSPLHQIAAPVLLEPPTVDELEIALAAVLAVKDTPRIRNAVTGIRKCAEEILEPRARQVVVEDMAKLYLQPENFLDAERVLSRHSEMVSGMRDSIQKVLNSLPVKAQE